MQDKFSECDLPKKSAHVEVQATPETTFRTIGNQIGKPIGLDKQKTKEAEALVSRRTSKESADLDIESKSEGEDASDGSSSRSHEKENSVFQKSNFALMEPIASSTRLIDKFINRLKGKKLLRNASPNNTSPSASFEERKMRGSNDPSQSINDENQKDFEELQNHLTILMETYKNVCQERDQLRKTLNQGNKKNNSDRIRSKFHTNSFKQPTILIL